MFGPRRDDDDDPRPRRPDRSLSTRLAWLVLFVGATALILRASLATVLEIHGDGMAPTLLDGDHVLVIRGSWGLAPGDLVIYAPPPPSPPSITRIIDEPSPPPKGRDDRRARSRSPAQASPEPLRNTAVLDVEDLNLGEEWTKVQRRSGLDRPPPEPPQPLRVGRILATPGDILTLDRGHPSVVEINGIAVDHKAAGTIALVVRGAPDPSESAAALSRPSPRGSAFETLGNRRYRVLTTPGQASTWPGMRLPPDPGPVELVADGYLILADNRDDGACCDSRALGFIPRSQIRGEIILRIGGSAEVPEDLDPRSRGILWRP